MKIKSCLSGMIVGMAMLAVSTRAASFGTAFTYQGRLEIPPGTPVNATCDFQFSLWDSLASPTGQIGSTLPPLPIAVVAGLFTVPVNFPEPAFQGDGRWLKVEVRCPTGPGAFTELTPRQELTPTPYALALPGLFTQQNATSPNLIGGFNGNTVSAGVVGAAIGGGGESGLVNRVLDHFGTVAGGDENVAGGATAAVNDAGWATVGGGYSNVAEADSATVAGGEDNTASGHWSSIGGGFSNEASGLESTVTGGFDNTASGEDAAVGGGYRNVAKWLGTTVAGGGDNVAGKLLCVGGVNDGNPCLTNGDCLSGSCLGTAGGTVSGGALNQATGAYSTVSGGDANTASALRSTVGGGFVNQATADKATVAGGESNIAEDAWAFVGGGNGNQASAVFATIAGGTTHRIYDSRGTVGGGDNNKVGRDDGDAFNQSFATICGGGNNVAASTSATVAGGFSNEANGQDSTVCGGFDNNAGKFLCFGGALHGQSCTTNADCPAGACQANGGSTVGGGTSNEANGAYSTVSGGADNTASGVVATVAGGEANAAGSLKCAGGIAIYAPCLMDGDCPGSVCAATLYSTVSGGQGNGALGSWSVVAGGFTSGAHFDFSTVSGGKNNDAFSLYTTIAGGESNDTSISALHSSIGGGFDNQTRGPKATIAGGDTNIARDYGSVGGGKSNHVSDDYGTIAGGENNTAGDIGAPSTSATHCTVGGGKGNTASRHYATVAGGQNNGANVENAAIGGGTGNTVFGLSAAIAGGDTNFAGDDYSAIGGGTGNETEGVASVISGGQSNFADGDYSTVPGGRSNLAAGTYSFAAGRRAKANFDGMFVWADSNDCDFPDSAEAFFTPAANQFLVRATGGAVFVTDLEQPPTSCDSQSGVKLAPGGGGWMAYSNRNAKANFDPVDARDVLARLAAIPIETWNLKSQDPSIRHIGPMAQDFHAAFGVGEDHKFINTTDADGVALAAIQGLYAIVQDKDCEISELHDQNRDIAQQSAEVLRKNAELETRLAAIEAAMNRLALDQAGR